MRLLPRLRRPAGRRPARPPRRRRPALAGVTGLLLCTLAGLVAYNADAFAGGTTYTAEFTDSAGLNAGDEVRVAGVRVGEVDGVTLDRARVKVTFTVSGTWVGDASTVGIGIKTLLGAKYLVLDPLGSREQDPGARIPLARTTSPYDVMQAFTDLGDTVGELDTGKIADSFDTLADTFKDTPPDVRDAVTGLSDLSRTIADRDTELAELFTGSSAITQTLDDQSARFESLLEDGNLLLGEIRKRRNAIRALLTGTRDLGEQLSGMVADNERQLGPTLRSLERVTTVLEENQEHLGDTLEAAAPYYRLLGNTAGNGRWLDSYACGVIPDRYLPAGTRPEAGCVPPKPEGGGR
ncbi:MCE family protein [Streptomyces sp. TRM 70351]|uniref:MCE family protein n=1 Tax=Streptomyces sp. TRM 70351 TaxID=3116552 RepID=UPI002E7B5567|nr:MCE family protein [Streptomyces sp. TRM 70351]MEE1927047.1 MCE family protein [Streptomyces sp. TRM 70351]